MEAWLRSWDGAAAPVGEIHALPVLLVGIATVLAMLIKSGLERFGIPPLVGFIVLGLGLRAVDLTVPVMTGPVGDAFGFLSNLGVVMLLFSVGLGCHPQRLLRKLPDASLIWLGNVALSGLLGYAAAAYLLAWPLIPSLVVAVALTATSIGVAVPVWDDAGALDSDSGLLTLDVAELDDISGVILMALLLAVLPVLQTGDGQLWSALSATASWLAAKLLAFTVFCLLFARYLARPLGRMAARWERPPERMLTVVGLGSGIAALAGALGFSLAIGALFAGLIFSLNAADIRSDRSYQALYDFLTPFFFIGIGLQVDPGVVPAALGIGLVLLIPAIAGKVAGAFLPALLTGTPSTAVLVGVSMVPRAEIAMVIMSQAHRLGAWAVPTVAYGGMMIVTVATCLLTPPVLGRLLQRWPQR